MKRQVFFLVIALTVAAASSMTRALPQELIAAPEVNGTILRTLTYHEITAGHFNVGSSRPILSGSGNRVVFTHYTYDPRITHIMTVNADGSQEREVHSFPDSLYYMRLDISDDGSKVLCTDQRQLYIVNADGSGKQKLIEFEYGRINALQFSGDGTKVFIRVLENGRILPSNTELKRGIWVMDTNGANLRQIVGAEQIAPLLGVSADQTPWFVSDYAGLDVSYDGGRLVFIAGQGHLFSVGLNGQGLVKLGSFSTVGGYISGDGQKVAYVASPNPCCSTPSEVWVVNADGSGAKKLTAMNANGTSPFPWPIGFPGLDQHIALNYDGSRVLLGDTGVLMDTVSGKPALFLSVSADINNTLAGDGLYVVRMNGDASRFVYCAGVGGGQYELGIVEVNPASLREAPTITEPKIEPGFVITNARSSTKLSARVATSQTLTGVGGRFMRDNLLDVYVCVSDRYAPVLLDNGTQGDATAGDGVYTDNRIQAFGEEYAIPGPRTVRVKAEAKTSDGKRHATAIDFEPFVVTNQTPLIEVTPTSLEFGDVVVGQTKDLTFTIRNTGTIQLTINTLTIDNTRFSLVSPSAPFTLNAGATQTVTVRFAPTATGQQRGTLTITSTDPARSTVTVSLAGNGVSSGGVTVLEHTMTGGPVPGACVKPSVKTVFAATDAEAIQWTLASGLTPGDAIRWEWVQPSGAIYRTFNYTLQQTTQGQACFWDAIQIAGQQAASLPGNWQVRVHVKGVQVLTENFTISSGGGACPTITNVSPSSGAAGTSVTITGTGFTGVSGVKFTGNVSATFTVVRDTQITATVPSGAVTGSITVSEPNCNDAQSPAPFTVTQPGGRNVRIVCATASLGGTLVVTVELDSLGDENAVGFSLNFDPAVLSNPQATKGTDTANGTLNVNTNQAAQGRVGLGVALPFGQTFVAGKRQLAVVTFNVSATTTATSTTLTFGDAPAVRRVSDANATALSANYLSSTCGAVPIQRGYEADVTPRPNGKNDGTISINDWVMIGRFSVGLDTAATGSEFQRADCAPRSTKGDGLMAIDDWVQAGRYFAALDTVQTIGGPTAPAALLVTPRRTLATEEWLVVNEAQPADLTQQQRIVRIVSTTFTRGQLNALSVEMIAQGDENAIGFSLQFDPNVLSYVSAETGSGASNALLIPNASQAANGRLGLALAMPAGERLTAGVRTLVTVRFNAASTGSSNSTTVSFGDQPIRRQIADVNANSLTATFGEGTLNLANALACVSAASFTGERFASEAIVAAFGVNLATATITASTVPLPTSLAETTVRLRDSAGTERLAPLFFVSAGQINYQIPPGTANGLATITVTSGNGIVSTGRMMIATVAPGLFAANANGQGVPAALALRVKADGSQIYEVISTFDVAQQRFVPLPLSLGPEGEQLFLILYGTGARNLSSLANVQARIGGIDTPVAYIGPVEGLIGLDQINVGPLPRSLAGRGEVVIALTVDGQAANPLTVNIR